MLTARNESRRRRTTTAYTTLGKLLSGVDWWNKNVVIFIFITTLLSIMLCVLMVIFCHIEVLLPSYFLVGERSIEPWK